MTSALFSYTGGKSFLHRLRAPVKLPCFFLFSFSAFFLPAPAAAACALCLFFWAIAAGIGFRTILRDLCPLLYYSLFLCLISLIPEKTTDGWAINFYAPLSQLPLITRMCALMCATSLFYRTTTLSSIRLTLENAEIRLRTLLRVPDKKPGASRVFSLYLSFIPQVFSCWNETSLAWKARSGKSGVKALAALVPAFFSLLFKHASDTALAVKNRE